MLRSILIIVCVYSRCVFVPQQQKVQVSYPISYHCCISDLHLRLCVCMLLLYSSRAPCFCKPGAELFGQASRKPMSKEQTERIHRKYVTWCVVNGRPWKAIGDIGLKLIIAEWDPMFAATTPTFETLDRVLREMFGTAKTEVIGILQSARD